MWKKHLTNLNVIWLKSSLNSCTIDEENKTECNKKSTFLLITDSHNLNTHWNYFTIINNMLLLLQKINKKSFMNVILLWGDYGTYRGINTAILNLETCSLYDWHRFDVYADADKAQDLVEYIQNLDLQVNSFASHILKSNNYLYKWLLYINTILRFNKYDLNLSTSIYICNLIQTSSVLIWSQCENYNKINMIKN